MRRVVLLSFLMLICEALRDLQDRPFKKYGNLIQRSASPECQVARSSSALNKNLAEARAEYGLSNQKNVTMHPKLKGTWTASAIIGEPFGRCAVVPMIWKNGNDVIRHSLAAHVRNVNAKSQISKDLYAKLVILDKPDLRIEELLDLPLGNVRKSLKNNSLFYADDVGKSEMYAKRIVDDRSWIKQGERKRHPDRYNIEHLCPDGMVEIFFVREPLSHFQSGLAEVSWRRDHKNMEKSDYVDALTVILNGGIPGYDSPSHFFMQSSCATIWPSFNKSLICQVFELKTALPKALLASGVRHMDDFHVHTTPEHAYGKGFKESALTLFRSDDEEMVRLRRAVCRLLTADFICLGFPLEGCLNGRMGGSESLSIFKTNFSTIEDPSEIKLVLGKNFSITNTRKKSHDIALLGNLMAKRTGINGHVVGGLPRSP